MTTLIAALFGGWLLIGEKIFSMFGTCKDFEFLVFRYLLDELIPLIFFFYSTIHRGSQYQLWQSSMIRLAIMFIVQQRHNYDKAMLSSISDCLHYETVIPQWQSTFSSNINVFSEKKIEVFHSLLRAQCPSWSSADQIVEFAHVLSARRFDAAFATHFLIDGGRKGSKQKISQLAGKAAEHIATKFRNIYKNCGKSKELQTKRKRRSFQLNTLACTLDQRSFPLGFSTPKPPSQDLLCDLEKCVDESDTAILLSCGHSFHANCLPTTTRCHYCEPFLLDTVKNLTGKFNKSLQTHTADDTEEEAPPSEDPDIDNSVEEDDYYSTSEFIQHLMTDLQALPVSATRPKFRSAIHRDRQLDHDYI